MYLYNIKLKEKIKDYFVQNVDESTCQTPMFCDKIVIHS